MGIHTNGAATAPVHMTFHWVAAVTAGDLLHSLHRRRQASAMEHGETDRVPEPPNGPGPLDALPSLILLTRMQQGDPGAREELVRRYWPRLMRWAHGRLPMGLREGAVQRRGVKKDAVLTYDDVTLPTGRLVDRLRAEQDARFPIPAEPVVAQAV